MRKLASVQRVLSVSPIENADRIERLQVLGWTLVSGKGNFKPQDLCVYLEIDCVPPDTETFDFLWQPAPKEDENGNRIVAPKSPRPDSFRLRSKRLRGVLSQGLALPVSILPPDCVPVEGLDVTEILGITKYEPPIQEAACEVEGYFPSHVVPKTDEIRVQAVPGILDELRGVECYTSVKLDGQSLTFARYQDGEQEARKVCTRNMALKNIPGSPHWTIAEQLRIFDKMPVGFAVQGEFVGPGIQANRMGLKAKTFYAFQVYNIAEAKYLDFRDFLHFCDMMGVFTVPVEWIGTLDESVESMLARADGKYDNGHPREGLVIRPTVERISNVLSEYNGSPSRASFKAISNSFLLKTEG
jgi:RNA ligase (TIGR02306 family)